LCGVPCSARKASDWLVSLLRFSREGHCYGEQPGLRERTALAADEQAVDRAGPAFGRLCARPVDGPTSNKAVVADMRGFRALRGIRHRLEMHPVTRLGAEISSSI